MTLSPSERRRLLRNTLQYYAQYYARRTRDGLRADSFARLSRHFVFLHIPKAGGSSLRLFFADLFGSHTVYPEVRLNTLPRYAEVASKEPRLYLGHLGYHFAEQAGAIKATVLRHPVERLLSIYSYAMNPGKRPPLIGGIDRRMTLLEFLHSDNPGIRVNIDAAQTWQLAYGYTMPDRLEFAASTDRSVFNVAKDNLSNIEHLGLLERLDRFQQRLLDEYPVKHRVEVQTINRSLSRLKYADLSDAEKQAIDRYLKTDLVLYEHARRQAD